jgi:signal peptidase I
MPEIIENNVEKKFEKQGAGDFWRFLAIVIFVILPLRLFVIQPFVVSGDSMYPTFENRDYLIVDALSYKLENPSRGDVVIFKYPYDTTRYFIKRIVGLPGETIRIQGKKVTIINKENPKGMVLDESYLTYENDSDTNITLKDDEFFVMGDNRPVSSDSRTWGPLEKEYIVGRPLLRLFPVPHAGVFPGKAQE